MMFEVQLLFLSGVFEPSKNPRVCFLGPYGYENSSTFVRTSWNRSSQKNGQLGIHPHVELFISISFQD